MLFFSFLKCFKAIINFFQALELSFLEVLYNSSSDHLGHLLSSLFVSVVVIICFEKGSYNVGQAAFEGITILLPQPLIR